jgi:hypothetical protein
VPRISAGLSHRFLQAVCNAGCGVCGGDGVQLDVDGVCCGPAGVITPSGYCCASGNVDDAGVCDGTGAGVPKTVAITDVAPFGFIDVTFRRRLADSSAAQWAQVKLSFEQLAASRLGYPNGTFEVIVQPLLNGSTATVRKLVVQPAICADCQ